MFRYFVWEFQSPLENQFGTVNVYFKVESSENFKKNSFLALPLQKINIDCQHKTLLYCNVQKRTKDNIVGLDLYLLICAHRNV